jgi:hypothetical protein
MDPANFRQSAGSKSAMRFRRHDGAAAVPCFPHPAKIRLSLSTSTFSAVPALIRFVHDFARSYPFIFIAKYTNKSRSGPVFRQKEFSMPRGNRRWSALVQQPHETAAELRRPTLCAVTRTRPWQRVRRRRRSSAAPYSTRCSVLDERCRCRLTGTAAPERCER